MKLTFKGGTHVREYKHTHGCPIVVLPAPDTVKIPLSQHIGAPAQAVVEPGERVTVGQVIGRVAEGLGCPVHSSVSGTVREIVTARSATGTPVQSVVIDNDGCDELCPTVKPADCPPEDRSPEDIIEIVREAGISGMGGATFPTHAKLRGAMGRAEHVIINCAECEPFITANHRLMLEMPERLLGGIRVLLCALGAEEAVIAIEDNKRDAARVLQELIAEKGAQLLGGKRARIALLKTKYPQGDERQLIYALCKKEIPAGKLPVDVGCVIFNAETTAAVARAYFDGMPSVRRIVTVDGDCIADPGNILAPIGACYDDLARACGGYVRPVEKVINGGPMMGHAQWDTRGSVTKGTSALLFLSEEFDAPTRYHSACIHCGRCVDHCPMHLMPYELAEGARKGHFEQLLKANIMSCVECGTCSYGCPAGVEIVQYIRAAKGAIRQKQAADRARAAQLEAEKGGKT